MSTQTEFQAALPDRLEIWAVDRLLPYDRNPRTHSEEQLGQLVRSIHEFGFTNPILVDKEDGIIAGHGRLAAAKQLGLARVPVIVLSHLTEEQRRAYVIADNQLALNAGWDMELLKEEVVGLDLADFDLELLGFDNRMLDDLLAPVEELEGNGGPDPDDVPEPPPDPITKPGDLWILGDHRLLCGDSACVQDAERVMNGEKADLIFTDPPYGVAYVGKTADALTIENDDLPEEELAKKVKAWFDVALIVSNPGAYWLATVPAGPLNTVFSADWHDRGVLRQQLVWVKDTMVMGRSEYHYKHEPILFGWVPGGKRLENTDRTKTSVWEFDRPKRSKEHPTMKPVQMWEYGILQHSKRSGVVFEPFGGSGTSVLACERTGRRCRALEIDPAYCDVIVRRWEEFTGRKAQLA